MREASSSGEGDFRWPALDGLRAVAVGLVMVGHYGHLSSLGSLGVETFYVISGFLITWLLLREYDATGGIVKRRFYLRRALRIFPAFYVFLVVCAVVLAATPLMPPLIRWLASATYTADYYAATHVGPSVLIHTWSLAVEEQFYLLWPPVLILLLRGGTRAVRLGLVGLLVGVTVWRIGIIRVWGGSPNYVRFALDSQADFLAIGALLAVSWTSSEEAQGVWTVRRAWWPWITIAGLVVVTATLDRTWTFEFSFPLKVALLGLLLLQLLQLRGRGVWGLLDHPVMRWLGRISYSLYLYHYLTWFVALQYARGPLAAGLLGAALAVPIAALSYYCVERPLLSLRDRRLAPLHSVGSVQGRTWASDWRDRRRGPVAAQPPVG